MEFPSETLNDHSEYLVLVHLNIIISIVIIEKYLPMLGWRMWMLLVKWTVCYYLFPSWWLKIIVLTVAIRAETGHLRKSKAKVKRTPSRTFSWIIQFISAGWQNTNTQNQKSKCYLITFSSQDNNWYLLFLGDKKKTKKQDSVFLSFQKIHNGNYYIQTNALTKTKMH